MNRVRAYVKTASALLTGSIAISACSAHDDTTLFVKAALAPKTITPGTQCQFTGDPTQETIPNGELDVLLSPTGYIGVFLLGNQLVPQANPSTPTTETSYIEVQGAVVTVKDSMGEVLNSYTRLSATSIAPSTGGTPTFGPDPVLIVDPMSISKVAAKVAGGEIVRVVSSVQFFGVTLGGQQITSNTFDFPVDICDGCLLSVSPMDEDSRCSLVNCLAAGSNTSSNAQVPCWVGQDLVTDCSQCINTNPGCDPNGPACVMQIANAAKTGDAGAL